jgi:phosphoglycerate-specific signal transduction histidine kinase
MEDLIKVNEEGINEIAEQVTTVDTGLLKKVGIGAAAIVVGGLTYKFVVKPIVKKFKAKKQQSDYPDNVVEGDFETED